MICQFCVPLLFLFLSPDAVNGNKPEKQDDDRKVDVIFSPFNFGTEDKKTIASSAVLSIALENRTELTLCFAFMVDGLVDVGTYPDTWTFFYM